MRIMEKDPCRGVVYLTVLCDHPYLVSILFSVLLFLHLSIFNVLYYLCYIFWLEPVMACYGVYHNIDVYHQTITTNKTDIGITIDDTVSSIIYP